MEIFHLFFIIKKTIKVNPKTTAKTELQYLRNLWSYETFLVGPSVQNFILLSRVDVMCGNQ